MISDTPNPSEDQRRDETLCRLLNTPSRNARGEPRTKPAAEHPPQAPCRPEAASDVSDPPELRSDAPPGAEQAGTG